VGAWRPKETQLYVVRLRFWPCPAIHERAGLAVPLGVETLAHGLRTMLAPAERARLTSRRGEVMSQLSWVEPLRQMDEIYRSLITGKR